MKKLIPLFVFASLPLGYFACGGGDKPAESPTTTTTSATTTPASTDSAPAMTSAAPSATTPATGVVAPAASSAATAPAAPVGMMQTVEMKWEVVADQLCKAPEKHVRLRFVAAEGHYTDVCSAKLADELGKKKPKTVRASYLVYRSPDSSSLCEIEGIVKGDKLPKMGCSLPAGWGEASGGGSTGNNPGPHPLFK